MATYLDSNGNPVGDKPPVYLDDSGEPIKPKEKTLAGFAGNVLSSTASGLGGIAQLGAGAFEKPVRTAMEFATGRSMAKTPEEEAFDVAVATPVGLLQKVAARPIAETITGRKMAPTWEEQQANQAIDAYKNKYGSLKQAAETAYEDPFGVAMDVSMLAGGGSGLARGGANVSRAANLGRTASALSKTADVAKVVAEKTNPVLAVAKTPTLVKKAAKSEPVQKAGTAAKEMLLGAEDPYDLATRAIKPAATRLDFGRHLQSAMPDIKAAAPKPITNVTDALDAVTAAKKANRAAYDRFRGPAAQRGTVVDMSSVADAMDASIPQTLLFEAEQGVSSAVQEVAKLRQRNQAYRAKVPLNQAEKFLQEANAELDAFYAKYPRQQWRALATNPESASTFSKAEAARNAIYNALDAEAEGAGARELQSRYGSLLEVEQQLQRRKNVAERQQPQSLAQQVGKAGAIGKLAVAGVKALTGDKLGALGSAAESVAMKAYADWAKEQQTTNAMLKRAFEKAKGKPAAFPEPAPVNIRGLLESGPIRMPGVEDPSTIELRPAAPAFRVGFPANAPRQLPAPAEGIGGRGSRVQGVVQPFSEVSGPGARTIGRSASRVAAPIGSSALTDPFQLRQLPAPSFERGLPAGAPDPFRSPRSLPGDVTTGGVESFPMSTRPSDLRLPPAMRGGPKPPKPRSLAQRPQVPEEGISEDVMRMEYAKENLARQMAGKAYADLAAEEAAVVDDLMAQGFGQVGEPPPIRMRAISEPAAKSPTLKKGKKIKDDLLGLGRFLK